MKFVFVGDVMLGRLVNELLEKEPPEHPWGDTLSLFRSADVRFANLECVIADQGSPWSQTPKTFHFRSDAKNVAVLKAAGIDCVSLANNHTLDYGYEAMIEMLDTLDRETIHHAGAGSTIQDAARPAIFKQNDMTIGFISFTDNEPPWEATSSTAGVLHVPVNPEDDRAQALLEHVSRVKNRVDWLIVSAHWGPNWGDQPQPWHKPFAHALVDHGADFVFGHSCHVFQGIELYKSRPIFYSCGDFVDDYRVDENERNDQSFVFVVEAEGHHVLRIRLYPTVIRHFQARRARTREANFIAHRMQQLCDELKTGAFWDYRAGCLDIPVSVAVW